MVKDGKEVGAIATIANKRDGSPFKFSIPDVLNYSAKKDNQRVIAHSYPENAAYGTLNSGRNGFNEYSDIYNQRRIDPKDLNIDIGQKQMLLKAPADVLVKYSVSNILDRNMLITKYEKKEKENIQKWDDFLKSDPAALKMTEKEYRTTLLKSKTRLAQVENIEEKTIPSYANMGEATFGVCAASIFYAGKYPYWDGQTILPCESVFKRGRLILFGLFLKNLFI